MNPDVVISVDKREDDRYHVTGCRWCDHIHRANKETVPIPEAEERGYRACEDCKPRS